MNYAIVETRTIASWLRDSDSPVSSEDYSAEPLFDERFQLHKRDKDD